jgi:hypothetical protein
MVMEVIAPYLVWVWFTVTVVGGDVCVSVTVDV